MKYYAVDLQHNNYTHIKCSLVLRAKNANEAEERALNFMCKPNQWHCVGIERAKFSV